MTDSGSRSKAHRARGARKGAGILLLLVLAGLWEIAKDVGYLDFQYLPRPLEVLGASYHLATSGALARDFAHTVLVTLVGWAASSVIGVGLGVGLGVNRTLWRYCMATFEVLRALPPIALVPAALLVVGFSPKAELAIVVYGAFLPTLVYTIAGIRGVTPMHYQVAGTLHLSRFSVLTAIVLPSAASSIVVGLRIGLGLALSLAVVAEMVGNPSGVGYQLVFQQDALNAPNLFVYVIGLGLVGLAFNAILVRATRTVVPGLGTLIGRNG